MENDSKIILFTPASRIRMLEDMNQQQYVTIKLLMKELELLRDKLSHLEDLLNSLTKSSKYDINPHGDNT